MDFDELLNKTEGKGGKLCEIRLKSGEVLSQRIFHALGRSDDGFMQFIVSEGKSTMPVRVIDIDDIYFYD